MALLRELLLALGARIKTPAGVNLFVSVEVADFVEGRIANRTFIRPHACVDSHVLSERLDGNRLVAVFASGELFGRIVVGNVT